MSSKGRRVAIVTGAAAGMGEAITRSLVSRGWCVAGFDVQEEKGKKLFAELGEDQTFFYKCNVGDYDSQAEAFQAAWDRFGRLDALCANAGIIDRSSAYNLKHRGKDGLPPKPDTSCTDVCFKGVLYGTILSTHFMRKNAVPGGQIVATSSVVGRHPAPTFPEYSAAKAAVTQLALSSAPVLKLKDNIRINIICPGLVATDAIPTKMAEYFGEAGLTPISTIVEAYNKFLDDPEATGQVVECSMNKIIPVPLPHFVDGDIGKRTITTYEGYFKLVHGEYTGLSGTIPE